MACKQTPEWLEPVDVDHLLDEDDGKRNGKSDGKSDGKPTGTKKGHNAQSSASNEGEESASEKDGDGSIDGDESEHGDGSVDGDTRETKVHESEWDGDLGWAAGEEEGPDVADDDGIVVYEENMPGEGFDDQGFASVDRLLACRNACDCESLCVFGFACVYMR
jgi:hypothetical protein